MHDWRSLQQLRSIPIFAYSAKVTADRRDKGTQSKWSIPRVLDPIYCLHPPFCGRYIAQEKSWRWSWDGEEAAD